MKIIDKYSVELSKYDIIDIHQTVNGQSKFLIVNLDPLDIRYLYDSNRKYEYDQKELLKPDAFTFETEWEILCNVSTFFKKISHSDIDSKFIHYNVNISSEESDKILSEYNKFDDDLFITADNANKMTNIKVLEQDSELLKFVYNMIKFKINKGEYSLTFCRILPDYIINHLEKNGYKITNKTDKYGHTVNPNGTIVEW